MGILTKNELGKIPTREFLRIKGRKLTIKATVISGKDGEHFISIIPSLMISGYGSTEEEADCSLDENVETFCEDFLKLDRINQEAELRKLGFSQFKYQRKNFSKLYVDENGLLQGLENPVIKQYEVAC
ncbi:hypothetical protein [Flavobacterium sp. SORGH_AS_0622]|uniref:hypothetical protein n=1 Tax=Flavobacterium sp. SORGH_AS_0622 TaxID=3041772 RepID=UPI0027830B2C|nr:hypothetical protein [Flavobacterium sp. SORGH_AS_0622]MDQ1164619.1 hypothetical protein [Flavobacterium sp. SORGH_AS_0622]